MTSRLRPRGDDGAYAILYALLLLVVLGMAALVVDIAALRQNRRETRLAADAAALAGAGMLDTVSGTANPRQACFDAWSYLATNLNVAVPASTGCEAFPTSVSACPATALEATGTVEDFTVVVTWPVHDTSPLMTDPDVKPASAGVTSQAVDPAVDGTDACSRIGVTVQQDEDPSFSTIFGTGTTSTVVTSVARSVTRPGKAGPIAALNVLEQERCHALVTGGQASIEISAVGDRPGIIAVESSGRDNAAGECPDNRRWVVDVAVTASGGHVWANGAGGVGQGTILQYALNPSPKGNPVGAFNPLTVPPGNLLLPRPTVMTERFGAQPVTDLYDCKGACPKTHTQYLTALRNAIGSSGTPSPYPNAPSPYNSLAFTTLANAATLTVPTWAGCTVGVGDVVLVPAGNWFVDCPDLTVRGILVFAGGTVVTRGGIAVSSSGCFAMNVPIVGTASCPTKNAAGDVIPPATSTGILYLRNGDFTKGSQASIYTERTFVYQAGSSARFDFGGGGTGTLYLTNPRPDPSTCDADCQNARFGRVALWNDASQTQSIGGQAGIVLRGIVFMPNSAFEWAGQGGTVQTNAQFWAKTIRMTGQGVLRMAPNPNDSVERPEQSTALIR